MLQRIRRALSLEGGRGRRRFRLPVVLAVSLGGLVFVTTADVLYVEWSMARRITVEFLNDSVQTTMDELERGVHIRLDPSKALLDDLAHLFIDGRLSADDRPALETALAAALAGRPELSAIVYTDPSLAQTIAARTETGAVRFASDNAENRPESIARFAAMRERRVTFWGDVIRSPQLREPVINVRRAIYNGDTLLGYLGAGVTIGQLSTLVEQLAAQGSETPFILYDKDGVIAHPALAKARPEQAGEELPQLDQIKDPVLAHLSTGEPIKEFKRSEKRGIDVLWIDDGDEGSIVAVKQLDGYGTVPWTLGLHVPGSLLTQSTEPLRQGAIIGLVLLIVALVLALLLGRLLAWPIKAITERATQISTFELAHVEPLPGSRIRELDEQGRAFNAMLAALRAFEAYVPRAIVRRLIVTGRTDAIQSSERDLTVMFTDIVGFTRTAERLPASRIAAFLNEHFAMLARCIEAEGGTVDKFIGDGLMAFWGAPDRLKQRAARACRAALAIREALAVENAARAAAGRPTIRLRIGLHRGPLVVGNIGSPGRFNYTVVGDAANVAQRLEQLGRELMGEDETVILASDAVVAHAGDGFKFARIGDLDVRGRAASVTAYRLLGLQTAAEGEAREPAEAAA